MKIAIIGVGLAGSNVLRYIIEHKNFNKENDKIYLFEKRSELAVGKPFEKDTILKMLNTDPINMSVNPKDPDEFVKWLQKKENPTNFEKISPREYYGEYISEYFDKYFNHENVNIIKSEVTDIDVTEDEKYNIIFDKDAEESFDAVFLTLGHPKYADFYKLEGTKNFVIDPYPLSKNLSNIKPNEIVGMIGAGATSIDVFRYIMQTYQLENPLYFLVRDSIFYTPHIELERDNFTFSMSDEWIMKNKSEDNFIKLEEIINLVKKDLKSEGVDFEDVLSRMTNSKDKIKLYKEIIEKKPQDIALIMAYLSKLGKYFSHLYGMLTTTDQHKLHKNYDKKIDVFFSLTPLETAKWMLKEYDDEKIKFIKDLEKIEFKNGKFLIEAEKTLEFDHLINTTGFDFNILRNAETNTLIKNLYDKKIIDSDEDGNHINITWPNCNIISKKYGELENMFCIGMWVYGSHYRANCAHSINNVTREVTNRFMDGLSDKSLKY